MFLSKYVPIGQWYFASFYSFYIISKRGDASVLSKYISKFSSWFRLIIMIFKRQLIISLSKKTVCYIHHKQSVFFLDFEGVFKLLEIFTDHLFPHAKRHYRSYGSRRHSQRPAGLCHPEVSTLPGVPIGLSSRGSTYG